MEAMECRLCQTRHWTWEVCKTDGVVVRREMAGFLAGSRETAIGTVREARMKEGALKLQACRNCGEELKKPDRGPMPKFCSDACRKAMSRRKG